MIRYIIFFSILLLFSPLRSTTTLKTFNYEFCSTHKFSFLFLEIYDVSLCLNDKKYLQPTSIFKTDFSIIIDYKKSFDKQKLANSSIKEIKKYYDIDAVQQQTYLKQLLSIFPNVEEHDIIEARYNNEIVDFYYNQKVIGRIDDKQFATMFLNIWLFAKNRYPQMLNDLFLENYNET